MDYLRADCLLVAILHCLHFIDAIKTYKPPPKPLQLYTASCGQTYTLHNSGSVYQLRFDGYSIPKQTDDCVMTFEQLPVQVLPPTVYDKIRICTITTRTVQLVIRRRSTIYNDTDNFYPVINSPVYSSSVLPPLNESVASKEIEVSISRGFTFDAVRREDFRLDMDISGHELDRKSDDRSFIAAGVGGFSFGLLLLGAGVCCIYRHRIRRCCHNNCPGVTCPKSHCTSYCHKKSRRRSEEAKMEAHINRLSLGPPNINSQRDEALRVDAVGLSVISGRESEFVMTTALIHLAEQRDEQATRENYPSHREPRSTSSVEGTVPSFTYGSSRIPTAPPQPEYLDSTGESPPSYDEAVKDMNSIHFF